MVARLHTRLSSQPLSVDAAQAFVADAAAGATVVFTGVVRNHADGQAVTGLDYEAYEDAAVRSLSDLAGRIAQRWETVTAVWIEHRVGSLPVGEPAVVVAVSAPHRQEAFDAARSGIDELKETAPIWKREHWAAGGSHWPAADA